MKGIDQWSKYSAWHRVSARQMAVKMLILRFMMVGREKGIEKDLWITALMGFDERLDVE